MALVYRFRSTRADENVLGVVGHSNNFVRHDLADGKNKVMVSAGDEFVDLCGPVVIDGAFRDLLQKLGGHPAQGGHVVAPVMLYKKPLRDIAEHLGDLFGGHRIVSPEGGQDGLDLVPVVFPGVSREFPCAGMKTSEVGRHNYDALARTQGVQRGAEGLLQVRPRQGRVLSSSRVKQHDGSTPT